MAVFFPNWVARESAISRSPLLLEDLSFQFSTWVESGEGEGDHLLHKAWIKLHNWPVCCWDTGDIRAAVSSFGALWEVDEGSVALQDVSFFRVQIRCRHFRSIPEVLNLFVEDRCFLVRIELESWEAACPILLVEADDRRLGLDTAEAQEGFLRSSGFTSSPRSTGVGPRCAQGGGAPDRALGRGSVYYPLVRRTPPFSNFNPLDFPPLPPYPAGCQSKPVVVAPPLRAPRLLSTLLGWAPPRG